MRPQTLLLVVLALAFGGLAAAGVVLFSNRDPSQGPAKGTIVVMTANVSRGETLSAESITAREYPKDLIPEGVLTRVEDAIGRAALTHLFKEEQVMEAKLAPRGSGRGLAPLIKKGMRAISIATPTVATGVAGFIIPGSHVDIYWTSHDAPRDDRMANSDAPLLENVEVLAVDEKIDAPMANRTDAVQMKSVTIQIKPEEAGKLTPVLSQGMIYLSLRNPSDEGRTPARPVPPPSKRAPVVAAVSLPPPSHPPAPIARPIRTIRGMNEGMVEIQVPTSRTVLH